MASTHCFNVKYFVIGIFVMTLSPYHLKTIESLISKIQKIFFCNGPLSIITMIRKVKHYNIK